jgi:glutamine amidotransferase
MHNGSVAFFAQIRVALLKEMSPAAQEQIRGTTDSEHIAMLFFTYLARRVGIHGPPVFESMYPLGEVKAALEEAITTVIRVQKAFVGQEEKDKFEASSLNIAITDGDQLLAIRFRNSASQHPPSLYYSSTAGVTLNRRFPGDPDSEEKDTARTSAAMSQSQQGVGMSVNLRAADSHGKHVIVASEPTTFRKADWTLVPKNHCVLVHEDISFEVVPVNVEF